MTALQDVSDTTADRIFGTLNAKKLRSSLTFFAKADPIPLFEAAIERWFGGEKDRATLDPIERASPR